MSVEPADPGAANPAPNLQRFSITEGIKRLYGALWRLSAGRRHLLFAALFLLVGSQLLKLAVPYVAGQAINTLQLQGVPGVPEAGRWLALVFVATLASWMLHGPGRILERNVALVVRERVSGLLVGKLVTLPLGWHQAHHSGAAAHRVQQSSRALYDFAQSQFVYLQNVVRLVGPVVALTLIDPTVGIAAAVGLTVIAVSITGFDRAMIRLAHQENAAERRYVSALVDAVANIVSVAAMRQARKVASLIETRLQAVFVPMRRAILVNEAKWCTVDLASQALSCLLLAFFVWRMINGQGPALPVDAQTVPTPTLALGNIYMVWEYSMQAGSVIVTIASQFQAFARQHADFASGDDVMTAAAPVLPPVTADVQRDWQRLSARALSFRHPGSDAGLNAVSLELERGRTYALVGGSGSGKSTLLRVLAGLYLPSQAQWLIDDAEVRDEFSGAAWLRKHVTLIPQDAEVIEGTLAENLALCESVDGPPRADAFAAALTAACATDFIVPDAEGLATRVSERGGNWSGGQRQRVALARGMLAARGSGLVLLDEPTAALDRANEQRVIRQMLAELQGSTVIASVHRLELLEHFDAVILMRGGQVIAVGEAAEVAAADEEFAAISAGRE